MVIVNVPPRSSADVDRPVPGRGGEPPDLGAEIGEAAPVGLRGSTGTTSPSAVATASPMLQSAWTTMRSAAVAPARGVSSEALKRG